MKFWILVFFITFHESICAQYFQQDNNYTIQVLLDTERHRYESILSVEYINQSPDTLFYVHFHLYYNAFQPNSMMDVRSRTIEDSDERIGDKILTLSEQEIGFYKFTKILQNERSISLKSIKEAETLLTIPLAEPILPHSSTTLTLQFEAQIPLQIRRTGRNNAENIDYSMTQWYPKVAVYDADGWHLDPYISREFFGDFGTFDVKIDLPSAYQLAHSGDLVSSGPSSVKTGNTLHHIIAKDVHDFAWSADTEYLQQNDTMPDGVIFKYVFQKDSLQAWRAMIPYIREAYQFISPAYGRYPYKSYTIAQGGDGGMEYPMMTLITAKRKLGSFIGTTVHELIHSWYQGIIATNEARYAWMDEGFTVYLTGKTLDHVFGKTNELTRDYDHEIYESCTGYRLLLNQHADHYGTNTEYGLATYQKGAYFLLQLEYIIGEKNTQQALKKYFDEWGFKHPKPVDFIRIAERVSDMELDWYMDHFVDHHHIIDYAIDTVYHDKQKLYIKVSNLGEMAMPLDFTITNSDLTTITASSPLYVQHGSKKEGVDIPLPYHRWVDTTHVFAIPMSHNQWKKIQSIGLGMDDTFGDYDKSNNLWIRN